MGKIYPLSQYSTISARFFPHRRRQDNVVEEKRSYFQLLLKRRHHRTLQRYKRSEIVPVSVISVNIQLHRKKLTRLFRFAKMIIFPRIVPTAIISSATQQISEMPPCSESKWCVSWGRTASVTKSNIRRFPDSSAQGAEMCGAWYDACSYLLLREACPLVVSLASRQYPNAGCSTPC
jgi:hypothetical protein